MTRGSTLQPAYVLHQRPFRNSSLLLELLTGADGRFPVVARGAAPSGRRRSFGGLLQPFSPLLVGWSGRGEVRTLIAAENAAPPYTLRGKALYCGFYLNELLTRLLGRHDPQPELFGVYTSVIAELAAGEAPEPLLRRFELMLLGELGYTPVLAECADDGCAVQPNRRYCYQVEHGPVSAGPLDVGTVSGATLLALARGEMPTGEGRREARELLRSILAYYLGDRPLKSRELFAARRRAGMEEAEKETGP